MLIDTGLRATELRNLNIFDIDFALGSALIRNGKRRKTRMVYFGSQTKKILRKYLSVRDDDDDEAVFVSVDDNTRLTYPASVDHAESL